jgi:hypothetical protein
MATITEDYVSFEIAKLLKEKGFDEPCPALVYHKGEDKIFFGTDVESYYNTILNMDCYACPTLQMAMKWLREMHELYIEVSLTCLREDKNAKIFDASIFNLQNQRYKKLSNIQGYKQAAEVAIKYCLKHLIQNNHGNN